MSTVLTSFSQEAVEKVVTHLDPILQSSLMQKVLGFIPKDIAAVLKKFDATFYPEVISLIDSEYQQWGEDCH